MIKTIHPTNYKIFENEVKIFIKNYLNKNIKSISEIIIKPAIGSCLPSLTGATIEIKLLEIVINILLNNDVKPIVIEAPSHIQDFDKTMEVLGIKKLCKKYNVSLLNPWKEKKQFTYIKGIGIVKIPKIFKKNIPIISIAKCKTHNQAGLSLGIKNFVGILPLYARHILHLTGLTNGLYGLYEKFKKDTILSIIDGIVGMEGNGPTRGTPVNSNFITFGNDLLFTDIKAMSNIGFKLNEVKHLHKIIKKNKLTLFINDNDKIINYKKPQFIIKGIKTIFITFPIIAYLLRKISFHRLSRYNLIYISEKCIKCLKCVEICPIKISIDLNEKASECLRCYLCVSICTNNARKIENKKRNNQN